MGANVPSSDDVQFGMGVDSKKYLAGVESGSKEISRWADAAMFRSEPMPKAESGGLGPTVILLNATPDPLGSLAALQGIYTGRVVRSLDDVSDHSRRTAYTEVTKNKLQGPLEVVQFHFLIEGVTRSFTHQMVRQREAFFAQESLRFAVVDGEHWINRIPVPPSIAADPRTDDEALTRDAWDDAIINAENYYRLLVERGVPAEDARGIMPHAMTTRLHWVTDLRGLLYVAGLRLCTQAQFEWRVVMAQVVKALRQHHTDVGFYNDNEPMPTDGWQFKLIAESLRPICYQEGKCGFKAKMDRFCAIRERVDANEAVGRPSGEWDTAHRLDANDDRFPWMQQVNRQGTEHIPIIPGISPYEWLNPTAARKPREEA
jgi:flavin-dependent thymidylate synthase